MNRIVECVPNFSEGRRPEIVDAIVAGIGNRAHTVELDRRREYQSHNLELGMALYAL